MKDLKNPKPKKPVKAAKPATFDDSDISDDLLRLAIYRGEADLASDPEVSAALLKRLLDGARRRYDDGKGDLIAAVVPFATLMARKSINRRDLENIPKPQHSRDYMARNLKTIGDRLGAVRGVLTGALHIEREDMEDVEERRLDMVDLARFALVDLEAELARASKAAAESGALSIWGEWGIPS